MFSNLNGPNLEIPKEFKLLLTNIATNLTIAEMLLSVSQNKIKLTLYDKKVTSNILPSLPNVSLPELTNMYIDFTQGKISIDFNTTCYWKNASILKAFTSEFFLKSYDLFTFYENLDIYHKYIITNPFKTKNTTVANSNIILDSNLKEIFEEVDKRGIIEFVVNKKNNILEKIGLKLQNTKIIDLDVIVDSNPNFKDSEFFFNNSNCTEINDLNKTISYKQEEYQDLQRNQTNKFLPPYK